MPKNIYNYHFSQCTGALRLVHCSRITVTVETAVPQTGMNYSKNMTFCKSLISPLLISPFIRVILRLAEPKDQSLLMETSPPLFANTRPILEYFRFACKIERAAFIIGLHLAIRRAARHNGFANLA